MHPGISSSFLADLELVCPKEHSGKLPSNFLKDLDDAYPHALALSLDRPSISDAELASLAEDLNACRCHHEELLRQYLAQVPEDDPIRSPISLFGTMDFGRLETAHTRTLAWLLDDKREHGFGPRLMESLLLHLVRDRQIGDIEVDSVESEHPIDCGPMNAGRIDVLAEGRWSELGKQITWVLAIEAKIDSHEGEAQLSQYDDWLERYPQSATILRVFLTPDGRAARTSSAEWRALSFVHLASVFRRVPGLQDTHGYHFLRYYLTGVLRDICRLPVPVTPNCKNPYDAVDYLQSVLSIGETQEQEHGRSR